jgi:hypothetical protein
MLAAVLDPPLGCLNFLTKNDNATERESVHDMEEFTDEAVTTHPH